MRKGFIVLGAVLALTFSLKGFAQQKSSFWSGTDPRKVQFKQIDTTKAIRPSSATSAFHAPPKLKATGVDRFFPKLSLGSWPPGRATVSVLDPKANPFQPNPKGFNPFDPVPKDKGKK